jgi:hypothetical protein
MDVLVYLQAQLAMIEMALSGDPENGELLQLKADLATLIQLTAETIQEDQAKAGNRQDLVLSLFTRSSSKGRTLCPQEFLTVFHLRIETRIRRPVNRNKYGTCKVFKAGSFDR